MKIKKLLKQYSKTNCISYDREDTETKIVAKVLLDDTQDLAKSLSKDLTDTHNRETFLNIIRTLSFYMDSIEYKTLVRNNEELLYKLNTVGNLE